MKELGYDTNKIMDNAGTVILTIQLWLFGVLVYSGILPLIMFILQKFHKQDLASFEKEFDHRSEEEAKKVDEEIKEAVIKKQKKNLADVIEMRQNMKEEEKKQEDES